MEAGNNVPRNGGKAASEVRFLVFGAGAIGSLIGGSLARKHAVTLVGRTAQVAAIRRDGLVIRGLTELRVHPRAVENAASASPPDVVVLAVKSFDTAAAVDAVRPFHRSALFLSLQNGLGNVERVSRHAERVLGGVTYNGVTYGGPGEVYHAGRGDTVLGVVRGAELGEAEAVAAALRECALPTVVTDAVGAALWTKAVVNACFNPLTGLLRVRSGAIDGLAALRECSGMIVDEAVAVAAGEGVELDRAALLDRVREVSRATSENRSSMLQDLEKGRRTEIDAINGAVARLGAEKGIPCPVNRLLTLLVKAAEEGAARE